MVRVVLVLENETEVRAKLETDLASEPRLWTEALTKQADAAAAKLLGPEVLAATKGLDILYRSPKASSEWRRVVPPSPYNQFDR